MSITKIRRLLKRGGLTRKVRAHSPSVLSPVWSDSGSKDSKGKKVSCSSLVSGYLRFAPFAVSHAQFRNAQFLVPIRCEL